MKTMIEMPSVSGFYELPVGMVVPTPDNPRREIDVESEGFRGLMASIRKNGILQPLVVRPHPVLEGVLDLRAGHRRHAAAVALGLEVVPCNVRVGMSDRDAMEATVTENLDREDLSPLEEARGIQALLGVGCSPDEVADDFGKPVAWVRRRAQLNKLLPLWAEFGEELGVKAPVLELIARYPVDQQDELLGVYEIAQAMEQWRKDGSVHYEVEMFVNAGGLADVRADLSRQTRDLSYAPWDLKDAALWPEAGACGNCLARTSANPELFDAVDLEGMRYRQSKGADFCLRKACYKAKLRRHCELVWERARTDGEGEVVRISSSYDPKEKGVLGNMKWREAKEGEPGAIRGVVVDGYSEVGEVLWIVLNGGVGKGTGDRGQGAEDAGVMDPVVDLVAKREGLERKRWGWICQYLQVQLSTDKHVLPVPVAYRTEVGLLRLAAVFGMRDKWRPGAAATVEREFKSYEIVELLTDCTGDSVATEVDRAAAAATESEWKQVLGILGDEDDLNAIEDEEAVQELLVRWTGYYEARAEAGDFDEERAAAAAGGMSCWERLAVMVQVGQEKETVWAQVVPMMREGLGFEGLGSIGARHQEHCGMVAELLGEDIYELKSRAVEACPEPASWRKLLKAEVEVVEEKLPEAQGKPKEVKVRPVKKGK